MDAAPQPARDTATAHDIFYIGRSDTFLQQGAHVLLEFRDLLLSWRIVFKELRIQGASAHPNRHILHHHAIYRLRDLSAAPADLDEDHLGQLAGVDHNTAQTEHGFLIGGNDLDGDAEFGVDALEDGISIASGPDGFGGEDVDAFCLGCFRGYLKTFESFDELILHAERYLPAPRYDLAEVKPCVLIVKLFEGSFGGVGNQQVRGVAANVHRRDHSSHRSKYDDSYTCAVPEWNMSNLALPLLHKALKRAFKCHRKQERDGEFPLPYITHPVEVVNILRYEGGITDDEVLAAGALHDVVEECAADHPVKMFDKIEAGFGPRVCRIVREVTREEPDRTGLSDEEVWQLRTHLMLEEIRAMSDEAKTVKLADRLSNVRNALATREGDKLFRYVRQTQLILESIDRAICPPIWDRVQDLVKGVKLPSRVANLIPAEPVAVS